MIIHTRIDERLIHGQVATMWTHTLKAERLMVIDNDVIKNEMEKNVLKMAKPAGTKLSILTVETAAKNILSGKYDQERVFVLVKRPEILSQLMENGVVLDHINVGNMSTKGNSKQVAKSISVTDQDLEYFDQLRVKGVTVTAQMTPNDELKSFFDLL